VTECKEKRGPIVILRRSNHYQTVKSSGGGWLNLSGILLSPCSHKQVRKEKGRKSTVTNANVARKGSGMGAKINYLRHGSRRRHLMDGANGGGKKLRCTLKTQI